MLDLVGRHHGAWTPPVGEFGDYASSPLSRYIRTRDRLTAFGPDGKPKIALETVRELIAQADHNGDGVDGEEAAAIPIGDS